jgi:protein TonB
MTRRPLPGLVLSLALHAAVLAIVVVDLSREDRLDALVIDLRDGFVPSPEPAGSTSRSATPAVGSARSTPTPRRPAAAKIPSGSARSELAPTPLPVKEPVRSPVVETPPSAGPVEATAEPLRPASPSSAALAEEAPRDPPAPPKLAAPGGQPERDAVRGTERDTGRRTEGPSSGAGVGPTVSGGAGQGADDSEGASRRRRSGQTLALGTSGGGSGAGPEYGAYLASLRQRIQQSLRYPASARRRGISGTVNVEILIYPNGTFGDVLLLDSSTHEVLDTAALDTIRALPRMPLPPDVPARPLRIRIPVVFQMR